MNSTAFIKTENGSGTGFYYMFSQNIPVIITNKHVIHKCNTINIPISYISKNENNMFEIVGMEISGKIAWHPDNDVDLCAILIGEITNYMEKSEKPPRAVFLNEEVIADDNFYEDILPMQDVYMIGYPLAIWDEINNGSVARKGIIASIPKNDYLGKKEFLVDIACFPGSSGSPIFIADFGSYPSPEGDLIVGSRIKLVGILYKGPMQRAIGDLVEVSMEKDIKSVTDIPANIGHAIKATEIIKIENEIQKLVKGI